ncbi:MAG: hypothetical protein N2A40_06650 [Desulfobulbaceae bacterium]
MVPGKQASEALASASRQSSAELSKGRAYFLRECRTCHRIYTPEERELLMPAVHPGRKSSMVSLTAAQYEKLTAYVMASSEVKQKKP